MPEPLNSDVVLFGETNFRNRKVAFGIKLDDRRRHVYVIGKTGMGKSELLKTLAIQDIQAGRGLAFVDPHGDPVEDLLDYIPEERIKDVIYINPADLDFPVAFNVMEQVDPDKRHLVADGVMNVFKKIWVDVWSARMEYILNNTILALLEVPDSTLLGINRMLADKNYRKHVVDRVTDPVVKAFWEQEFAKYTERFAAEATPAIQNKVGQFTASALVRNIIGQPKSTIDMRQIMDEGKILLVNIAKGRIGEDASRLLGALIITKLQLAAMSRVDIPEKERRDFTLIVDEFQNFATSSFANILSEARKYRLSLIVAHQYVAQMDETVRDAVFGNVGTIISFRVGAEDAELLEKELAPEFMATDIVNLGKRQIYLKLMIDGIASKAFSALTMDTPPCLPVSNRGRIVDFSRSLYAKSADEVEKQITQWHEPLVSEMLLPTTVPHPPRSERPPISQSQRARPIDIPPANPVRVSNGPKPVSLSDALRQGPVDFKGRRLNNALPKNSPNYNPNPNPQPKPKPEIDVKGLKELLEEAMQK